MIIDKFCFLIPETYKAFSSTSYTGKTIKVDSDVLLMNIFENDSGYKSDGDKSSKCEKFLVIDSPKMVAEIENGIVNEEVSDDLQGKRLKNISPSNIINIFIRLEIVLGLKLFGHTNNLTEASNSIDEFF